MTEAKIQLRLSPSKISGLSGITFNFSIKDHNVGFVFKKVKTTVNTIIPIQSSQPPVNNYYSYCYMPDLHMHKEKLRLLREWVMVTFW